MTDTVTAPTTDQSYRVAFDVMAGVEPMTFLPGTTTDQITARLHAAFLAADVIRDGQQLAAAIDVAEGTVVVSVDGAVIEHGSITAIEPAAPKPGHQPTALPTILTFGAFNLPEARLSAYAEGGDITDVIGDELSSAGYDLDTITMRFADGGRAVEVLDGDEFVLGTVTVSQPEPDYWLTLADDLHRAADRLATLAGTAPKPSWVSLSVQMAAPGNTDPTVTERVDTLAAAFGVKATARKTASLHEYGADMTRGALRLSLYAYVPAPEDPEKAALEARVAELEARLGEGGTR